MEKSDCCDLSIVINCVLNGLNRADHLISLIAKQADPTICLQQKLVPDMFSLAEQLSIAIGFTVRTILPLVGRDVIDLGIGETIRELRLLSIKAKEIIHSIASSAKPKGSDKIVSHIAGEASLRQTTREYVHRFAVPNMWFHLSMAYAILRSQGVDLGKSDFDGLHAYTNGFSFQQKIVSPVPWA